MTRGLGSVTQTTLARDAIVSYLLLNIAGYRYTDAPFDIVNGVEGSSNTYDAQGEFLGIAEIDENSELAISSIQIDLSALAPSVISQYATSSIVNQDVKIYRILFDQGTGSNISDDPVLIFQGRIAGYRLQDADETATLSIQVDSQFTNFEKITCRRTNNNNFQREFPNDHSMEFSHETLADLKWGKK